MFDLLLLTIRERDQVIKRINTVEDKINEV